MRTFSFNRPLTLLFALPMLLLVTMFVWGLTVEFRVGLLVMLLVTGSMVLLLFYMTLLRRLRIGSEKAVWSTPMKRYEMRIAELRHFGIVKFRRFRFIYLSRAENVPFQEEGQPVVSDPDTFLIQYRPGAWTFLQGLVKGAHPHLQPESFSRN
jgi:hypothetical protein